MADTDGNEWVLLDTDLTARVAILPAAMSHLYFVLNEPGSGELKIPLESNAAALIESGQFAQASYRGGARGGFFVDNIQKMQADASEGGGKLLSISGRGGLALLEDAIVWDDGTTASTREFASMTKADILITLIDEAQARGGLAALTYDFSATDDSDSVAWDDSESYQLSVGTSVLDVLRQFAKTGIDFDIVYSSGSFVLSAYKNGKGTDKSETIYFRTGVNCEEVKSDERGDAIKNALRVAYKAGNVTITDGTSITNRRRREKLLDARVAQTASSATTYGSAILANSKDPRKGISVKIYDGVGPRVFLDYDLGDYIMLDVEGTETSYRVLGIRLDWDGKDYSNVVVELNTLLYENEIRMAQDIDWLLDQWETARDAGLLEVSYWAAIGDASTTYNVSDFCIIGDYLYMINGSTTILKYGLKTGIWYPIVLTSLPNCLAAVGTDLYIGGLLQVIKYDTLTDTQTSVIVADTGSPLSANVTAFAVNGTTLYAGGQFTSINGVAVANIAQLDTLTDTWSAMADEASFLVTVPAIMTMLFSNGLLYSSAGTQVQAWNGTTWSNIGSAFGANVLTFAEYGTDLLAGGQMTNGVYIWDGATWEIFGGGVNAAVRALGVYLTDVYIGGSFTDAGNYVARYSGSSWWQLESGVNALVDAMILIGQDLYVGGDFTEASGKPAQGIAAYFNSFESLVDYLENSSSSFNMGAAIHAAAASAITDTDEVPFWEASVNALRKITWANIKATLKTYFDTLYVALTGAQTIAGIKTFSSDPIIPDEAYDATNWNGSLEPPTKNAVRDKIESMSGGGGTPGGSDTQIQFNDGGAFGGDASLTWDKTNNMIEMGGANWYTGGGSAPDSIHVTKDGGGAFVGMLFGHSYVDGTDGFTGVPSMGGDRAGGSRATPTAVLDDMGLSRFIGAGYDGTAISGTRAQILLRAAGNWSGTSHPTKIELYTTPSGSTTRAVVLTIGSDGNVNIESGKTYNIAGSPHTHAYTELTSRPASITNTNALFSATGLSSSGFTGTIATLPGGAVLTYNVVSGNEDTLNPQTSTALGKQRLYNTTRGTHALISSNVVGTNTTTLSANVPAGWVVGDTITTLSPTIATAGFVDIELTTGDFVGKSTVFVSMNTIDTGGAGAIFRLHPFESPASTAKYLAVTTQSTQRVNIMYLYPLKSNIISMFWTATGAGTQTIAIVETGYLE